jgi:chemotaxis protein methyltransferase CheR
VNAPFQSTPSPFAPVSDIQSFRRMLLERSGLNLTEDKDYLLKSRLAPVVRDEGLPDLDRLFAVTRADPSGRIAQKCIDALATHESFFFRDATPFDQLRDILLPRLIEARRHTRQLRIWSAACSSGQEPYSLAMLMMEERERVADWRIEIVATDMSASILERARTATYSDFEVNRGLSPVRRDRWLRPDPRGWRVADDVRAMVTFRRHNLLDGVSGMGRFDLIFCRNVLIYFDQERKASALRQIACGLELDGALVLGSAETVVGLDSPFVPLPGLRGAFGLGAAR